jgi:short-subunit dehydrogenase
VVQQKALNMKARSPRPSSRASARIRKLAVVTGATSGIGRAFAELSNEREVAGLVRRVEKLERVDVLVSNAGYGSGLAFKQAPIDDHLKMVAVHVTAALRLAHAVLPGMAARRQGKIVTVASFAAFLPLPGSAVYCAMKAFLNSLAESIAMEVGGLGIRVQSLCPGLVRTDFHGRTKQRAEPPNRGIIRWMSAEQVVDRSFRDLARGRVLCIPGFWNRVGFVAAKLMPRKLYSRLVGLYR